jgi:D-arabinose 1-dehydrogenase-like Zn-dependent alcohol dehydrogenase
MRAFPVSKPATKLELVEDHAGAAEPLELGPDRQHVAVAELFPLEGAAAAYARMLSGEARFRVVLTA